MTLREECFFMCCASSHDVVANDLLPKLLHHGLHIIQNLLNRQSVNMVLPPCPIS